MLEKQIGVYAGVDTTAPSLHIGHLVAFMPLFWMYMHGFGAYSLIGTSTAKIGDPTGRSQDRPTLQRAELLQNTTSIHYQLSALWQRISQMAPELGYTRQWSWTRGIINNNAWWNKMPLLEVMKYLGSQVRIGQLLARDNVKTRIESGAGMAFSEFTYPLMQGWDWFELYKQRAVQMQIGGSDQYSNITIGSQCVKSCIKSFENSDQPLPPAEMFGFTVPLLTTSKGAKFGKSEGNALWLDPFRTTPYDFYGYLVRRADTEVEKLLKLLTFMPLDDIAQVMAAHEKDPPARIAQHTLAFKVTEFVHGKRIAHTTQIEHRQVYGTSAPPETPLSSELQPQELGQYQMVEQDRSPRIDIKLPKSLLESSFPKIVCASAFAESTSEANRLIKAGGMYVGGSPGQRIHEQRGLSDGQWSFTPLKTWDKESIGRFVVDGTLLILRKGKHNIRCIQFIEDDEFERLGLTYNGQPYGGRLRRAVAILRSLEQEALQANGKVTRDILRGRKIVRDIAKKFRRGIPPSLREHLSNPRPQNVDPSKELKSRLDMIESTLRDMPVSQLEDVDEEGLEDDEEWKWVYDEKDDEKDDEKYD